VRNSKVGPCPGHFRPSKLKRYIAAIPQNGHMKVVPPVIDGTDCDLERLTNCIRPLAARRLRCMGSGPLNWAISTGPMYVRRCDRARSLLALRVAALPMGQSRPTTLC
jgi:hypothetical protein